MPNSYRFALATVVVAALTLWVSGASAITNPVVDFGVSYAKELTPAGAPRLVGDHTSTAGDALTIVGKVVMFQDPFADLNPNAPGVEYTYIMTGLTSLGTTVTPLPPLGQAYETYYSGGVFRIFEDTSPDADYADMSTFIDGTLILEGVFTNNSFHLNTFSFQCAGTQNATFQFTGGSLFSRVSSGGVGFTGINTGSFTVCSGFVPAAQQGQGYFGMSDTKLDVETPTPATPSTWGQIKSQYRD
jgi:hypothetical protein